MTNYWIAVDGCQRVIAELRAIMEDKNKDFQWVDDDMRMVDSGTFRALESGNVKSDSEKVDQAYTEFLNDKLTPTYESIVSTIENLTNAMEEAVNYYVSGDAAMAAAANGKADEFPEIRSEDGSSTDHVPRPEDIDPSQLPVEEEPSATTPDGEPNPQPLPPPEPPENYGEPDDETFTTRPFFGSC